MRKVIDCFSFNDELDMLEFHLKEMSPYVDYFIISEGTLTHAGMDKPLHLKNNIERFSDWQEKIIHIVVDDFPDTNNPWDREAYQRNSQVHGFKQIESLDNRDIILITDCDEIVDRDLLDPLKQYLPKTSYAIEQDIYYYNLNCKHRENKCFSTLCDVEIALESSLFDLRFKTRNRILRPGGWHFSYFGGAEAISNKLNSFAHQDLNLSRVNEEEHINLMISEVRDLFGREEHGENKHGLEYIDIKDNKYLPKNYKMLM